MKRLLTLGFILALVGFGSWIGAQIEVTTSTVITLASRAVDDTGTYVTPDSVRIVVYREGVEAFDAWFESADGECSELNTQLVFFDAFGDIDGGAGTGIYQVSANFKESDDEYWVNTWYNLVDTTTQTYGSIIFWRADEVLDTLKVYDGTFQAIIQEILDTLQVYDGTFQVVVDDILDTLKVYDGTFQAIIQEILDTLKVYDGTFQAVIQDILDTLQNQDDWVSGFDASSDGVDVTKIDGDATAAANFETMLDGTGGEDLTLGRLRIYAASNETAFVAVGAGSGHGMYSYGGTSGYGFYMKGGSNSGYGLYVEAERDGVKIEGGGGEYPDILLAGDGTISGTIDRVTVADSATAVALGSADADTLASIRDYTHAVIETVTAHAPHGDNWAVGTGVAAIADSVNAILDTIQAHAPHGNDWGQGGGSLGAIADSVNAILDTLQLYENAGRFQVNIQDILDTLKVYDGTFQAVIQDILDTLQNQDDWVAGSADFDSINNAIHATNKANFKATGFATTSECDSIEAAISDANKANFKADTASIARSTWDDDVIAQASRIVTASCGGSGLRAVNIYVLNSVDSAALQSFTVSVDDSSSQTFIDRQATDSDGLTTWGLDDDTYEITFSAAGWSITSPVYLTVTADDDTTYYATQYSPTPPSATYCTVYTHTYKLTGAYSGCRLEARIPVEYGVVTSATVLWVPYVVADTSEADGKAELNLPRSTNLTSSTGLTPVKVHLLLFDPWGNTVADTLMEIPDQASKAIWITP